MSRSQRRERKKKKTKSERFHFAHTFEHTRTKQLICVAFYVRVCVFAMRVKMRRIPNLPNQLNGSQDIFQKTPFFRKEVHSLWNYKCEHRHTHTHIVCILNEYIHLRSHSSSWTTTTKNVLRLFSLIHSVAVYCGSFN